MARDTREKLTGATIIRGEDLARALPKRKVPDAQQAWFEAFVGCVDPGFEVDSEELIDEV